VEGRNPSSLPPLVSEGQTRGICSFLDRCSLRVDGVCNNLPPPRHLLDNGGSILCHRSEAELRNIQIPLRVVEGEVA
jgi:peptide/nickel transport system ATP-binding protein